MEEVTQSAKSGAPPGPHGYVTLLGLKTFELRLLLGAIAAGLAWKTFEHFRSTTGMSAEQVADMAALSRRTLARRKNEGRLSSDESDRLVRAARIYDRALHLFDGDRERATRWITTPNMALGGETPLSFMATEIGAREVEQVIGRAEHGVYS
jgi:putative toxin-antitoxin system antitoxin component (TIGR02293 family)